jgi:hypothetical protein
MRIVLIADLQLAPRPRQLAVRAVCRTSLNQSHSAETASTGHVAVHHWMIGGAAR